MCLCSGTLTQFLLVLYGTDSATSSSSEKSQPGSGSCKTLDLRQMCIGKTADLLSWSPDLIDPAEMRRERKPDNCEITQLKHYKHLPPPLAYKESCKCPYITSASASFSNRAFCWNEIELDPQGLLFVTTSDKEKCVCTSDLIHCLRAEVCFTHVLLV